MKKMFNKKFFLILGSSITLLIVLSVAMFFLTKGNVKTFTKEGYIIASSIENDSKKYYFDEGTSYKKNISSQLVFTDTSGEKVKVETDNFMHYIDGGIKFLKNGVIMDLNNVDSSTVPYYNITDKSVLEYSSKSYFIETIDKTLSFNNIAGRISENKYIFAGVNVKLQLAGNEKIIEGDYFEVNFIEDGIIKVENQEVSYQTTAEDSYILVDNNIKINLGNKKIYYNEEEKMSLTQMTIDGNENIEIIPEEDDKNSGGSSDGDGSGTGEGEGTGNEQDDNTGGEGQPGTDIEQPGGEDNPQTGNDGEGTGENGTGEGNANKTERDASVELVKAEVGATNLNANFILNDPDRTIKGDLVLHITNTDTGTRVYSTVIDKSQPEFSIDIFSLAPDANYILSINEETNEKYDTQYYQKLFKTESLGISLEKQFVTQNSISYKVLFEEGTEVDSAVVTLYDQNYNQIAEPIQVTKENNTVYFENLKNNTSYNVVLNNVTLDNLVYVNNYTITKSIMTLKNPPYLEGLSISVDDETKEFTIGVNNVSDVDKSITKYSYYIYKADDITIDNLDTLQPVKIIEKNDKGKVNVTIDNKQIFDKVNYRFKVVAEYYDNEKYGEFETILSDNFILSGKPTIEFIRNNEETTFNKIVGTIKLTDDSCTVPIKDRECSIAKGYKDNTFKLMDLNSKEIINVNFDPKTLEATIEIDNLKGNTTYNYRLSANVDLSDQTGLRIDYALGDFTVTTKSIESLSVSWDQQDSTRNEVINVLADIYYSGEDTVAGDFLGNSMRRITFNLYVGDVGTQLENKTYTGAAPIAFQTVTGENVKEYYRNTFPITTTQTFGIVDREEIIIIPDVTPPEEEIPEDDENTDLTEPLDEDNLGDETTTPGEGEEETPIDPENPDVPEEPVEPEPPKEPTTQTIIIPSIEVLKELTGTVNKENKLAPNYTIEITGVYDDENGENNEIEIKNRTFNVKIPNLFILEDELSVPSILVETVKNGDLTSPNGSLSDDSITKVKFDANLNSDMTNSGWLKYIEDRVGKVTELIYYACDAKKDPDCDVSTASFTKAINTASTDNFSTEVSVSRGTNYATADKNSLRRGNKYIFKLKFLIDTNGDDIGDEYFPTYDVKSDEIELEKTNVSYKSYILETNENTAKYRIELYDFDRSLYEKKIYYTVKDSIDSEEEIEGTIDLSKNCTGNIENIDNPLICDFEINGLTNDSIYTLSFNEAKRKWTKAQKKQIGNYIFDGKYAYTNDTITYSLITSEKDNILRIKIDEKDQEQNYINRIAAYEVTLSANGLDDYVAVYTADKIANCTSDENSNKCIMVDYADIAEFKNKDITVKVKAYYDSGLIYNDFSNEKFETIKNIGYILQQNNYYDPKEEELTKAKYLNFTTRNKVIYATEDKEYPTAIFGYTNYKKSTKELTIYNKINGNNFILEDEIEDKAFTMTLNYLEDKIRIKPYCGSTCTTTSAGLSLNNKIVSEVSLGLSSGSKNTFKFSTIIPKIKLSFSELVNGTTVSIKHSGISDESLSNKEIKQESDGKYYYYIDVYYNKVVNEETGETEKVIVEKDVAIPIDLENTNKITTATFTGYMPNSEYWITISADIKNVNGNYIRTLLFNSDVTTSYEPLDKKFNTLGANKIIYSGSKAEAKFSSSTITDDSNVVTQYLKRELELSLKIKKNIGEYTTRFELWDENNGNNKQVYVFENVELSSEKSFDLAKIIDDITPSNEDIKAGTDFVFGQNYYTIKAYITTSVKEELDTYGEKDGVVEYEIYNDKISPYSSPSVYKLREPSYSVYYKGTNNSLTFDFVVNDPDKTIIGTEANGNKAGGYCVVLLGPNGEALNNIEPNCTYPYQDGKFIANPQVTYTGLNSNSKYTFKIYTSFYTNNIGETEKVKTGQKTIDAFTSKNEDNIYLNDTETSYKLYTDKTIQITFKNSYNLDKIKTVSYDLYDESNIKIDSASGKTVTFKVDETDKNTFTLTINLGSNVTIEKNTNYMLAIQYYLENGHAVQNFYGTTTYSRTLNAIR